MNTNVTPRQAEILRLLAREAEGLTMDELAATMGISRPAARQHLTLLEAEQLVERGEVRATGGRPGQRYVLGGKARELFPRQYSWFAQLLLGAIKRRQGGEDLKLLLEELAREVAQGASGGISGDTVDARIASVLGLLNQLGYDASLHPGGLRAVNCVFHHLAAEHPEVCAFDIELLARLIGSDVVQETCMVRGGTACTFRIGGAA